MEFVFDAGSYAVREVEGSDGPEDFMAVFNSNPKFLDASTLRTGVTAFTAEDVEKFLWHNTVMENSHCLVIRTAEQIVGVVTLLVPHPREGQPWVGSLIVDGELEHERVANQVLAELERILEAQGWTHVFVGPMVSMVERIGWWRSFGYLPVERRLDNDKREVEVHRKLLRC
ncbi:GNAT family N-acetyltransferase [Rhodococcus fascians]|jgi:ribosomal protein S18 acetylase RimI-like enzyme|nr:GNAT family N-acetyltransferase [Rhodococcus fascians]MBY4434000.1 GNAT family N-acetyltransferase [Rhodococcus fascians]